jgi:NAD+ synthase (glutamine-hydrolysing)
MKFVIAQINTTPCDFEGNLKQILEGIRQAGESDCKLVVFPELSIPGYLSQDLMFDHDFVERNYECVGEIRDLSKSYPDLRIIVGCIDRNTKGVGKPFWNMALMIHNSYIMGRYKKQLLPFYDVFDEGRYFEPGKDTTVFEIDGLKFGITICEDLWNDKEQKEQNYFTNPVQQYRDLNVDCLINISSSPYSKNKPLLRQRMIDKISKGFPSGVIYVNQVGGQDELVFDGCSSYSQYGDRCFPHVRAIMSNYDDANPWYRCLEIAPLDSLTESRDSLEHSSRYMKDMLVMGLRDYIAKSGFKSVVLGSSGGIDSAVVACLAAEAIGSENVHCIMMPSVHSSDHSLTDAKQLHKNMGCHEYEIPIDHLPVVDMLVDKSGEYVEAEEDGNRKSYNAVADENIQARIRGSYIMWFSNATGALTLTTGNKTELAIGYATLYGDMCGGYAPICDLYKMEVYDIAKKFYYNWIPKNIIDKEPSAELAEGQLDSNELLPYNWLDTIVEKYIERNIHKWKTFSKEHCMEAMERSGVNKEEFDKIIRRIDNNEFKRRQYAPGTKISRKSFGIGRRIPIVKGQKSS